MKGYTSRKYLGIPVGVSIRRQLAKTWIYRVRRGNGFFDTEVGETIQDRYAYVVPGSINNPESEPYRRQWIAAVHKWRYDLTAGQKKEYNDRAGWRLHMSGYNLFMREAMKGLVEMYVDRGDPATVDYVKENLTIDGAWHDLDLSSIIPSGAKAVLLRTRLQSASPGDAIRYRQNENTNEINVCGCEALRANVLRTRLGITGIDANRVIEYNADNIAWTQLDIVVRAWWT